MHTQVSLASHGPNPRNVQEAVAVVKSLRRLLLVARLQA
jgi:hypothetical protein